MFDGEGTEIGWMRAIHDEDAVPDVDWQMPYVYDWELTHPEPDSWQGVENSLCFYADPAKMGKTENIEMGDFTLYSESLIRLDEDGPEAYLEEVASAVEREGASRTKIVTE